MFRNNLLNYHLTPTKQGIKMDIVGDSRPQRNFQGRKKTILKDTVKVGLMDIQDSSELPIRMLSLIPVELT